MSYGTSFTSSALFVVASVVTACAPSAEHDGSAENATTSESALDEPGTVTFAGDFTVHTTGAVQKGKKLRVAYDADRLTACRGDFMGQPGWSITGFWKIGDGDVHTFEAGGFSPSGGTEPPVLTLDQAGDLQLWFQNTSRWGCSAYDSAFGANYHLAVAPADGEPGWLGNARYITSRQTCSNGPCDSDLQNVTGDIVYDTYVRQRTAIRELFFEAWKAGTTDFDNPDLWKQLDVQVHSRVGDAGAFTTAYVPFDRRVGNNARYGLDLRPFDAVLGLVTVTDKADCPPYALTLDPSGQYVQATVELYFTVNGVELRPAPGAAYRVVYSNYKALYAVCLP